MRVFVILSLLLALFSAAAAAQTANTPQPDSLKRYIQQQFDSIKLEVQKAESRTLADEARQMREDANRQMDRVVKMISVLVALIAIILAISGFQWYRTQRQVREAQEAAVKSTCEKVEKDLKPQVEAILETIRNEGRSEIEELKSELKLPDIGQPISPEELAKLRQVDERLKRLEESGGRLTAEDYVLRARKLRDDGLFDLALNAYNDAISEDKANAKAWLGRGYCLAELARREEAIQAYDAALRINPDHHEAHYNRGISLDKQGRYEEAIQAYDAALKTRPGDHQTLYCKARDYAILRDKPNMLTFLAAAVKAHDAYRERAKQDSAFKDFRDDPDFKAIVEEKKKG